MFKGKQWIAKQLSGLLQVIIGFLKAINAFRKESKGFLKRINWLIEGINRFLKESNGLRSMGNQRIP